MTVLFNAMIILFAVQRTQTVVTGSTDGIGKEYAKQLALRGINIVLIARNESKLIQVAREIGEFELMRKQISMKYYRIR